MTLKEHIQSGEKLLDELTLIRKQINTYFDAEDGKERTLPPILLLLKIEGLKLNERIFNIESQLAKLRKQYAEELEMDSLECNEDFEKVMEEAKKFYGREPKGVSDKLVELANKWETIKDDWTQEDKNDIYFEIKGVINFFRKK